MRRDPLLHPAFLVALAALWLNDHTWKLEHPGWWTGKISDFAGLLMLPVLVHALLRRLGRGSRRTTAAFTVLGGVWFSLANLWAPGQLVFEHVFGLLRWLPTAFVAGLGGQGLPPLHAVSLTPDPSDLLALPMIVLGWLLVRGSESQVGSKAMHAVWITSTAPAKNAS